MPTFCYFDDSTRNTFLAPRQGETKFGEKLNFINSIDALNNYDEQYVIFGIPEDVGIRGNYGKPGAATTWNSFLGSFLNIQVNSFNHPENCLILGHLNCDTFMAEAQELMTTADRPQEKLGPIADAIDKRVINIVQKITAAEKTPIIIGGGHNNSFGNITGSSKGLGKPINILNIDAHTDLRRTDYRHSGNGFSYAKEAGSMAKYAMYGIHRNYTPQYIFDTYRDDEDVNIWFFENYLLQTPEKQLTSFNSALDFLDNEFGLEIDCDAITGFSSSAMTPSGFSINAIRKFILTAKVQDIHYLHLTEAAAKGNPQIGKALSYFVSDFICESY